MQADCDTLLQPIRPFRVHVKRLWMTLMGTQGKKRAATSRAVLTSTRRSSGYVGLTLSPSKSGFYTM